MWAERTSSPLLENVRSLAGTARTQAFNGLKGQGQGARRQGQLARTNITALRTATGASRERDQPLKLSLWSLIGGSLQQQHHSNSRELLIDHRMPACSCHVRTALGLQRDVTSADFGVKSTLLLRVPEHNIKATRACERDRSRCNVNSLDL